MRQLKFWWPALVWCLVIWSFSTSAFTSENTASRIIPILHWLLPHARLATLETIHSFIRKAGHVVEYFIFSLLVWWGIRAGRSGRRLGWALAAIAVVAGYAALDEFHQSFVPGRGPSAADVLLDTTAGAVAQIAAALAVFRNGTRDQQKKASEA
jgi:VanZ family protein